MTLSFELNTQALALAQESPLDFTLQYPPRREYFKDNFSATFNHAALSDMNEFLLYLHIPFCAAKCYFCNFAVDTRNAPAVHDAYVSALVTQLDRLDRIIPRGAALKGIDIGGGTPTILDNAHLLRIGRALEPWLARAAIPNPLSIETTPSIAADFPDRLKLLRDIGITRLSMGVQSTNVQTLESVNRARHADQLDRAVENIHKAGFDRFNIDIIFGLPGQTMDHWMADLERVPAMGVDSITTYDCLYRGKGRALTKRTKNFPTPEEYGTLYDAGYKALAEAGFHAHYGSVNFSRHAGETGTSPYFERRLMHHIPYIGTGNYASSLVGNNWAFAPHAVPKWQAAIEAGEAFPVSDSYDLPVPEVMAKQVLASLNFGYISRDFFEHRFDGSLTDYFGRAVSYALKAGWMVESDGGYGVAAGQFARMPLIRALFYSAAASQWLHDQQNDAVSLPETQTRGLVIGRFVPPHLGHVHLIERAAKNCDTLDVLVMAKADDPLPGDMRTQWLQAACPQAHIRFAANDLPVDYADETVWQKWVETITALLARKPDVVFSSETYGADLARRLGARHVMVDVNRTTVPVSGTAIRNDYAGNRAFVVPSARAWLDRHYGFKLA